MATPVRFPSGVSGYVPKDPLSQFPSMPAWNQFSNQYEMVPYTAGDFTVTASVLAATAANTMGSGVVVSGSPSAATAKHFLALNGNATNNGASIQAIPGLKWAFETTLGGRSTTLSSANTTLFAGLLNVADGSGTISHGIYFTKPTSQTYLNLVIKKSVAGVITTTTISKVADLAVTSGIYGDTTSTAGTLTTAGSGGYYTSVAVATAGSGYANNPVVYAAGATGANATLYCRLGSGSLYAPQIANDGDGNYTTYTNEVVPLHRLGLASDGKTLFVGVNGVLVCAIGPNGATALAAGDTTTTNAGSYYVSSTLSSSLSPVAPGVGSICNIAPVASLIPVVGLNCASSTATYTYFVDHISVGADNP